MRVSTSTSLVGSSSSSTLGPPISSRSKLQPPPLATGQVADPGDEPLPGQAEPLRELACGQLAAAAELDDRPYVLDRVQRAQVGGSSATVCDR